MPIGSCWFIEKFAKVSLAAHHSLHDKGVIVFFDDCVCQKVGNNTGDKFLHAFTCQKHAYLLDFIFPFLFFDGVFFVSTLF